MEVTQILLIVASALVARGWYGVRKWCPHCNKWNGLKKIDSEYHRTETRYRTETLKDSSKDAHGRTYRTRDRQVKVPYNVDFYKVLFECNKCHKQTVKILRSNQYFKEAGIFFGVCAFIIVYATNQNKTQNKNENSQSQNSSVDSLSNKEMNTEQNSIPIVVANPDSSPKEETITAQIDSSQIKTEILQSNNITQPEEEIKNTNQSIQTKKEIIPTSQNEQIKITKETPEYKRAEYAISMLQRGKDIDEVVDSTFLSKHQVKKIKRNLKK